MKTKTPKNPESKAATLHPVIELTNNEDDAAKVSRLVSRLGGGREDDTPEEAAMRLGTMALMLSDIAAAQLVAKVGETEIELGIGFAVEGGILSSDIAESVIAPVFRDQELWERNLLHEVDASKQISNLDPRSPESPSHYDFQMLPIEMARKAFKNLQGEEHAATVSRTTPLKVEPARKAAKDDGNGGQVEVKQDRTRRAENIVMQHRRFTSFREVLNYRVFIADGTTATGLEQRVLRAHLGRFLLHARIDSYESMARIGKTIEGFRGHRNFTRGKATMTLRVDPVLCVGAGVLNEAILRGTHRAAGFTRLLWLVESTVGCELPDTGKSTGDPNSQERDYRGAVKNELKRRINFTNTDTHALPALEGCLSGWKLFLKGMEKHCPGIRGAAGNLPIALCYGLEAMSEHTCKENGEEVVAFAKWLVMRMVNRVAAASYQRQHGRIEQLAARLAEKLSADGPLTQRQLIRKSSKLKADDCRQALSWLAERGLVALDGDRWGILRDPALIRASLAVI